MLISTIKRYLDLYDDKKPFWRIFGSEDIARLEIFHEKLIARSDKDRNLTPKELVEFYDIVWQKNTSSDQASRYVFNQIKNSPTIEMRIYWALRQKDLLTVAHINFIRGQKIVVPVRTEVEVRGGILRALVRLIVHLIENVALEGINLNNILKTIKATAQKKKQNASGYPYPLAKYFLDLFEEIISAIDEVKQMNIANIRMSTCIDIICKDESPGFVSELFSLLNSQKLLSENILIRIAKANETFSILMFIRELEKADKNQEQDEQKQEQKQDELFNLSNLEMICEQADEASSIHNIYQFAMQLNKVKCLDKFVEYLQRNKRKKIGAWVRDVIKHFVKAKWPLKDYLDRILATQSSYLVRKW